jgi:putative membrane protein
MRFTLVLSLVLAVLTVVFALQNDDPMTVDFLFVQTQGSTALVLIVTFALGVIVGLLSTLPGRLRDRRELKKIKKRGGGSSLSKGASGPSAFESMPDSSKTSASSPPSKKDSTTT